MKFNLIQFIIMLLLAVIAVFIILIYLNSFKTLGYVDTDYRLEERIEKILENYDDEIIEGE